MMTTSTRVEDARLRAILDNMGGDKFAGIDRTIEFKVAEARSILSELLDLREAVSLIREEAGKDNAPFGRSDGLALNRIRIALEISGRSLSQGAGHEQ